MKAFQAARNLRVGGQKSIRLTTMRRGLAILDTNSSKSPPTAPPPATQPTQRNATADSRPSTTTAEVSVSATTVEVKGPTLHETGSKPTDDKLADDGAGVVVRKTQVQIDEEVKEKFAGMSEEGGPAALELENGRPVAMKRGVRENMFRVI